jgi:hypothetical protein
VDLDDLEWRGQRDKGGKPESRWQKLPPLMAPPGVTALSGQVLRLNGEPLANVTFSIGGAETRSDRTGSGCHSGRARRGVALGAGGSVLSGGVASGPAVAAAKFDWSRAFSRAGKATSTQ